MVLLLLVLILAGGFGWVVHRARVQRDAVAAIEAEGGSVGYERFTLFSKNNTFETPKWLITRLGADYLATVKSVYLIAPTQGTPRGMVVYPSENSGKADLLMAHVARLDSLESVALHGIPITDAGLARLRGLKRLKTVSIRQAKVTAAGLNSLAGLDELQTLDLTGDPVTDADLAQLRVGLRSGRAVRDGSIDYLFINLSQTKITDAGLLHLVGLRSDVFLDVKGTAVTDAGAAAFLKVQHGSVDR